MRLSKKQRQLLNEIANNGTIEDGTPIPLYATNFTRADLWLYESEYRGWLKNLEERGLIRIEHDCFLRITEKGTQSITP